MTGPDGFSARLVLQQETHLPVLLMWQQAAPGQAAPAEYRIYYADFRDVNGVKWPFRVRRAIAGQTIEETTFDRIRTNAKIDAKNSRRRNDARTASQPPVVGVFGPGASMQVRTFDPGLPVIDIACS